MCPRRHNELQRLAKVLEYTTHNHEYAEANEAIVHGCDIK